MIDDRDLFERTAQRFDPPTDLFERLAVRRHRKRRNERIGAAVLALVLATVALGGAARVFLRSGGTTPADAITRQNVSELSLAWTGQTHGVPGRGNAAPTPVLHDGVVYTVADGLYAFPASCADSTCQPLWTSAERFALTGPPPIAFGGGEVFMLARSTQSLLASGAFAPVPGQLFAYPTVCGESGSICRPAWSAQIDKGWLAGPVFMDGQVFVASSSGHLYAFDAACGSDGATCFPAWVGEISPGRDVPTVIAADGYVVAGEGPRLVAFTSSCGAKTCAPAWVAQLGAGQRNVGSPTPIVAEGSVYSTAYDGQPGTASSTWHVAAFPLGCGSNGATCDAQKVWSGDSWIVRSVVVADGRVLVTLNGFWSGHELEVFEADCAIADCPPLWSAKVGADDNAPAVADGMVFVNGPRGLEAFPLDCSPSAKGRCAPSWTGPPAGEPDTHEELPVVSGGLVFVGPGDGHTVYALPTTCRTDGGACQPVWTGSTRGVIRSSPVASGDHVFIGTGDGKIVAFGLDGSSGGSGSPLPFGVGLVILLAIAAVVVLLARRRA